MKAEEVIEEVAKLGKILSRVVKKNLHCLCHVISICGSIPKFV